MKAAVYRGPGDVRIEQVPDPVIEQPTDVIVRVTHAAICGSDLWFYRGLEQDEWQPGMRTGHEWIGIVEDIGSEVRTIAKGDRILAPFAFSDGICDHCARGLYTSCRQGGFWGTTNDGGQAEALRAPFADGTLVVIPDEVDGDDSVLKSILPLTDVMATGHHAAVSAATNQGNVVTVVGDGAVGLCGVLAARRLGAERIVVLGHNNERLQLARQFGASEVITSRDEQAVDEAVELTGGGADSVLECVGSQSAMNTAIAVARPGGTVGYVGVPHGSEAGVDLARLFASNITLRGGVAPARAYIPELLADVVTGALDPSPVLDLTVGLDEVPAGYTAMDRREAIKVMVRA